MSQPVTILGATGSIGLSTLDVVGRYPDRFHVHAVAGGSRIAELVDVCRRAHPKKAVIADESKYAELKTALVEAGLGDIDVHAGQAAVAALAEDPDTQTVVQAVVGAAGVAPTFAAARAGKRLLLANKESVVCGGGLLMRTVRDCGAELLPVDSEHNAIFQCLSGASPKSRAGARILLTASGGPFRGRKDLKGITVEQALAHPRWNMGRKISIDSATLMNKGLEVIEARWLFDFEPSRIQVVVHPESIVHSAVEFEDGAVIAQLGSADMRTPIAYSLGWPERLDGHARRLSLTEIGRLTFEEPDTNIFPLLRIAYEALEKGDGSTIVLNAANEIAVEAFLARRIPFDAISKVIQDMLARISEPFPQSVEEILALDARVREETRRRLENASFEV
ncbi:MAG: 1-deoxy-D-xylulose-5-phosphate reductoisomerase [Sutterella sp.]|nr:1-deoxy-D-xylulose-5-phosphate reductoisomerase [Sutterella sp.]